MSKDEAREALRKSLWEIYRRPSRANVLTAQEDAIAYAADCAAEALAPRDAAIKRVMAICESPDEPLEWSKAILDALGGCWADSADPAKGEDDAG